MRTSRVEEGAVTFAYNPPATVSLVAGALMVGLAAWTLALEPGKRLYQSFALMLFLLGVRGVLLPFAFRQSFVVQWGEYVSLATPGAILFFTWAFYHHYRRGPPSRLSLLVGAWVPWVLLLGTIACEAVYFQDHAAIDSYDPATKTGTLGWLAVVPSLRLPFMAACTWVFLVQWRGAETHRSAWFLLVLAFLPSATFFTTSNVLVRFLPYLPGWTPYTLQAATHPVGITVDVLELVAALLMATAAWWAWRRAAGSAETRTQGRIIAGTWLVVAATSVATRIVLHYRVMEYFAWPHFIALGLWSLALPVFSAGPVLRSRVLNVDRVVRLTVQRGTVVSISVAMGFVAVEVLANFLSATVSLGVGMGAAALLLLLLHPLQRMADRLSRDTVPEGRPVGDMTHPERLRIYAEQAELAWMDGTLQRKERMLLDRLRERLGLSLTEAAEIERRAIA